MTVAGTGELGSDEKTTINRTRRKSPDKPVTRLPLPNPTAFLSHLVSRYLVTMPTTWQSPAQKVFFEQHLTSYVRHIEEGKIKAFWVIIFEEWLELWPLSEPPAKLIEKKGSVAKAEKAWRSQKLDVSVSR
jgi:hypothetical protein